MGSQRIKNKEQMELCYLNGGEGNFDLKRGRKVASEKVQILMKEHIVIRSQKKEEKRGGKWKESRRQKIPSSSLL